MSDVCLSQPILPNHLSYVYHIVFFDWSLKDEHRLNVQIDCWSTISKNKSL